MKMDAGIKLLHESYFTPLWVSRGDTTQTCSALFLLNTHSHRQAHRQDHTGLIFSLNAVLLIIPRVSLVVTHCLSVSVIGNTLRTPTVRRV